ncbi:SGNH/GDSL hydrolase family protein [Bifidobacterium avesanii]|uniref:SGNH hydrolase-type esterase domain-containing protein n=1 Tax=Bifidobacterium avesanii TaxID=1798157 RepID=A0A7K3THH0_9BIFI|nr:SGNH/GDSL hydrolase family protein [Bifidobacterium avesanii]KAB8292625.1 lipolytic protein G-D-S-L family [Bifidobacterium avesanii]NEG78547.1 hypothetical protein [Bifidobacterium avesanii]
MTFAGNPSPVRPPRVVCIGDSITFGDTGLGYIAPRPWPLIAGERLGAEFVNCGHCGASTADYRSLPEWTRARAALPGASLVTVMLGTNDIDGGHSRDEAALRRVIERYESIVSDVRELAGPNVPVAVLTIAQFALDEPIFSRFTYGELVVMNHAVDRFNALLRDAAASHGWHVVEMAGVIDGRRDLYGNTIHPNDRGYEVMADAVTPRFARLLGGRA